MSEATQSTDETVEIDGEEYTADELARISNWWEDKATEALNKDDDWGYEMAREKMMKAENAKKKLQN